MIICIDDNTYFSVIFIHTSECCANMHIIDRWYLLLKITRIYSKDTRVNVQSTWTKDTRIYSKDTRVNVQSTWTKDTRIYSKINCGGNDYILSLPTNEKIIFSCKFYFAHFFSWYVSFLTFIPITRTYHPYLSFIAYRSYLSFLTFIVFLNNYDFSY